MEKTKQNVATENEKDRNKKFFYTLRLKGDVKTDHKTDSNPLRTGQRII